jgi:hypothetical protein
VLNLLKATSPAPQADLQVAGGEKLRHRCRNPQCRAKLPASVTNAREAFCCRGCLANFFRVRCRVCEGAIEQPTRGGARFTCNKAKCRRAWRAGFGFGRYHTFNHANSTQERPVNTGSKVGVSGDRASWRVIAAEAPISANQYHCAIVGGAEVAAADQVNATHWRAAKAGQPRYRHLAPNPAGAAL